MKAISVRQPFANDICFGEKTIELRTWQTAYRGELIICSSRAGVKTWLLKDGVYYQAPMGATICKVNLVDCRPATKADADDAYCNPEDITDGMWAWVLEDVVDLEPKPVKGKLNFFDVPDELIVPCGDKLYHEFLETGKPNEDKDIIIQIG